MDVENDPGVIDAKEKIDEVFGDTGCSRAETLEKLEEIRAHIDPMIDDLKSDNDDGA